MILGFYRPRIDFQNGERAPRQHFNWHVLRQSVPVDQHVLLPIVSACPARFNAQIQALNPIELKVAVSPVDLRSECGLRVAKHSASSAHLPSGTHDLGLPHRARRH